jgi:hypothetical protein
MLKVYLSKIDISICSFQWSQATTDRNTFHACHFAWIATAICSAVELIVIDIYVMLGIVYKHLVITF